jgi:HD-GYP domain-containing protein (c-di-GMP phosphodiesterase class II)
LQLAEQIAASHHERWNGSGYPAGLAGEEIPLPGRIVAIADVFDALTHERPYKQAWPVDRAVAEILAQSGEHFDPALVDAFAKLDHGMLAGPLEEASAATLPGSDEEKGATTTARKLWLRGRDQKTG